LYRALIAVLCLPWLWPATWGPLTNAVPWLVSAACAAVALALSARVTREQGIRALAWSLVLGAGISAVIALIQWAGLDGQLAPFVAQASPGMAYGNLRQPNQLASLLAMGIWASFWLWRNPARAQRPGLLLAYLLLLTAALVASASRIGLVHIAVLCAVCLWWWAVVDRPARRERAWLLPAFSLLVAGVYLGWLLLAPWLESLGGSQRDLMARLSQGEATCGSRLILWRNVLHLIGLKPWTGWGWGNLDWAHYMTLYEGPRFCHILDNAHNLPLHIAVEWGLPVAAIGLCLVLWNVWRAQPWREAQPTRRLAWGILLVIGAHSLVEYPLWYGPFQLVCVCALALLLKPAEDSDAAWLARQPQPALALRPAPAWRTVLAGCLAVALAYVAFDYWRISQLFLPSDQRVSIYAEDTLEKAGASWLFRSTVDFAALSITPVTASNAGNMLSLAQRTLHYSPEPRVVDKLIQCARLQQRDELVDFHLKRMQAAYPNEYQTLRSKEPGAP
jgi:O-antigen ligase